MHHSRLLAPFVLAVLVGGCGSAPPLQSLQPAGSSGYALVQSPQLARTDHMTQHLDKEQSIVYFQNQGGGGVATGLLLGPIGVAMNMSMIETTTKKDVEQLRDKLGIRPTDLFAEAAKRRGLALAPAAGPKIAGVTPYVYVVKTEADMLFVNSALLVQQESATGPWTGKYLLQLPVRYPLGQMAKLDSEGAEKLRGAAIDGFSQLLAHLGAESAERVAAEQRIHFKSPLVSPGFDFEMIGSLIQEEGDLVWIRTVTGVLAIRKPNITYTIQKPAT